jgi:ubiquinone biosynthesis protein COQ4
MRSLPTGRRLLSAKPDIVEKLADRAALARAPEGSLAHAYLEFVTRENISAAGIRAAYEAGHDDDGLDPSRAWMAARMRDTHDLWHTATGYTGDALGEAALAGFQFAQTWNPGIAVILSLALLKTATHPLGAGARRTIYEGFVRGLRAAWLPAQEWEDLLVLPLSEVRGKLGLGTPPAYTPIRSYELRIA